MVTDTTNFDSTTSSISPRISNLTPLQQEEEFLNVKRKLEILGTDVESIPCFRNSFLYGITSGFGLGIAHFAFTSKIRKATSFGFYSYVAVTFIYWLKCRYDYAQLKFQYQQLNYAMQESAPHRGSEKGIDSVVNNKTS